MSEVQSRAVRELPVDVTPVVEDVVRTFEVRLGYRKRFERRSEAPLVLMTRRRRLDAFLAEQAATAGADFRDGVTVGGLTVRPDGVDATIGGSRIAAPVLAAWGPSTKEAAQRAFAASGVSYAPAVLHAVIPGG